jgi:hypothetical protein
MSWLVLVRMAKRRQLSCSRLRLEALDQHRLVLADLALADRCLERLALLERCERPDVVGVLPPRHEDVEVAGDALHGVVPVALEVVAPVGGRLLEDHRGRRVGDAVQQAEQRFDRALGVVRDLRQVQLRRRGAAPGQLVGGGLDVVGRAVHPAHVLHEHRVALVQQAGLDAGVGRQVVVDPVPDAEQLAGGLEILRDRQALLVGVERALLHEGRLDVGREAELAGFQDDAADRDAGGPLLGYLSLKLVLPRPQLERDQLLALVDNLGALTRPSGVVGAKPD